MLPSKPTEAFLVQAANRLADRFKVISLCRSLGLLRCCRHHLPHITPAAVASSWKATNQTTGGGGDLGVLAYSEMSDAAGGDSREDVDGGACTCACVTEVE